MNKFFLIGFGVFLSLLSFFNKAKTTTVNASPIALNAKSVWVDSVYNNMTLKEKVGQLFMVAAYSNREAKHIDSIQQLIADYGIGGLIFFQGGPVRQANLTNRYQALAKVPLLVGIDAEWGLNMRLDSTSRYPYNMTLGAIQDETIIESIGQQIGKNCKRLGIHLNFAPVVDINTNPNNPIIGVRSFGEQKNNVTQKALAFTKGIQSEGVLACAKHFPGHGDTDVDSHLALPTVNFSKKRIDSVELYPYKKLFKKGIAGVMVAHLNVPALEGQKSLPSSLSYNIVTSILKEQLKYEGLVFTDALNMKGAANFKAPGDIDLAAFLAGNDVLLFTENAPKAIAKIIEAYKSKLIDEKRLAHSVKKILSAKYDVGLYDYKPIKIEGIIKNLNSESSIELYGKAIDHAITLIQNKTKNTFNGDFEDKIAYLSLGDGNGEMFRKSLSETIEVEEISGRNIQQILKKIKPYKTIIIAYHRKNSRLVNDISKTDKQMIESISKTKNVILDVFASQYCLKQVNLEHVESLIVSYENTEISQQISADIILGKRKAKGRLAASI
ncbi:glycoside hydrolase family 3 protein [Aestuariibaculum sediminum]|uniref:beta-N-acetylhexosaminidase n=1 Tax=Aestuariibaculum sediminum TaxID=2770637 RepID=A0A8J6Q4A2_9FLAO|nr:glycoside hydrolase family 3 protein [Aestuariibaculum sediminum]MBD0833320.1 glycoside hydrolase family 3 protein [Aestuariibaculum sediminum]